MRRLDRYLVRTILALSLLVGLGLTAIYTFTTFVGDLDETGKGGYGLLQLAAYTVLNLPSGVHVLLPIIGMIGTLLGMGLLAGQGELTAMRAAGVSNLRIGASALLAGALLGGFGWWLGDWLAPQGRAAAERLRSEARYGVDAGAAAKPVWVRDGQHIFRIGRLRSESHIENVTIYTLAPDLRLDAVARVAEARFADGQWQLRDVARTRFGAENTEAERLAVDTWRSGLEPQVLRLFVLEARSLSTHGLMQLIAYRDANRLDATRERLTLWRKFVAPATVMAMMLFAVPFAFGALRDSGTGVRLLIGVLVGVVFYVANEVTASFGQLYAWHPAVSAGLPTAALAAVAVLRLLRSR